MTTHTKETCTKLDCCFVGPRPQSLPFRLDEKNTDCLRLKQVIKQQLVYLIEALGVTNFISDGDLGIGQYTAEIILDLKREYPIITLEFAIPCENQAEKWTVAQRERYFYIVEHCDKETLLQHHHTRDCEKKLKEYMVGQSKYVLAVWNGRPGGTRDILFLARILGKPAIIIDPKTFEVRSDSNKH